MFFVKSDVHIVCAKEKCGINNCREEKAEKRNGIKCKEITSDLCYDYSCASASLPVWELKKNVKCLIVVTQRMQ